MGGPLNVTSGSVSGCTTTGTGTATGYTIGVSPASGSEVYYISRQASGAVVRFCTVSGTVSTTTIGGGCVDGTW
jgi:hypothetical protein